MGALSQDQARALRAHLAGRPLAACFGAGVDSTAMLIALHAARLRPSVITFADTGGEKPETLDHLDLMQGLLMSWGWPPVDVCRKLMATGTPYSDLFGNCMANETLPSLAFGMKSCSLKFKASPQDQFIKGARSGPNARVPNGGWTKAQAAGQRIVKLIGYDCGRADMRRASALRADPDFDFAYPLQIIGWTRADCVRAILEVLGPAYVPIKSACYFCPASKQWELWWLAAFHPGLLENALAMERNALTGRHSRFDAVTFGATWEELVRTADRFPSTSTTVGLGRSFAWNQWARVNGVVDDAFRVLRSQRARFLAMATDGQAASDNAFDSRSIRIVPARAATSGADADRVVACIN